MLEQIKWLPSCCGWHGDYAEFNTKSGKTLRIKRGPSVEGYLIMIFENNVCKTLDEDGVPVYENVTELELISEME